MAKTVASAFSMDTSAQKVAELMEFLSDIEPSSNHAQVSDTKHRQQRTMPVTEDIIIFIKLLSVSFSCLGR